MLYLPFHFSNKSYISVYLLVDSTQNSNLTFFLLFKDRTSIPVEIRFEFFTIQAGKPNPMNSEMPNTSKFLEEFRFTYCKLDAPTAVNTPTQSNSGNYYKRLLLKRETIGHWCNRMPTGSIEQT